MSQFVMGDSFLDEDLDDIEEDVPCFQHEDAKPLEKIEKSKKQQLLDEIDSQKKIMMEIIRKIKE